MDPVKIIQNEKGNYETLKHETLNFEKKCI